MRGGRGCEGGWGVRGGKWVSEEIGFWYIFAGTSPKCRIIVSQKRNSEHRGCFNGETGLGALLIGCSS